LDAIMNPQTAGDEASLERLAERGDPTAQFAYAKLLLGDPRRTAEGPRAIALIEAAASSDHADAVATSALFEATGALRPQSWSRAFDRLQLAAELGSESAQGQLLALAGRTNESSQENWAGIRGGFDVEKVLAPPARQVLSQSPKILAFPGFATATECAWAIARARDRM
jgi:hypothetical protein